MAARSNITLWHVPISHYAEKARWALDYKRVPHTRRRLLGGTHPPGAFVLTRGRHQTIPVLTIDGRGIGDSTAIIAELERRFPDRPLYPADPGERRRALELEDFFDEELGPYIRRLAYHELSQDPDALVELTRKQVPWVKPWTMDATMAGLTLFLNLRFKTGSDERAREAEVKVFEALDRLEAELDGRAFLVGDSFSVADLTAASLFYPLAMHPAAPWRPTKLPAPWAERIAQLEDRPGVRWIWQTYERYRRPAAAREPARAATAA